MQASILGYITSLHIVPYDAIIFAPIEIIVVVPSFHATATHEEEAILLDMVFK